MCKSANFIIYRCCLVVALTVAISLGNEMIFTELSDRVALTSERHCVKTLLS